jgi:hypothetical protein
LLDFFSEDFFSEDFFSEDFFSGTRLFPETEMSSN